MREDTAFGRFFTKWIGIVLTFMLFSHVATALASEPNQSGDQPQTDIQAKTEQPREPEVRLNKEYFKGYLTDTEDILTAPARWESTDWIKASVVLGISVGLFTQDDKIQRWVQKNKNTTTADISDDAKKISTFSLPALGGLGLYGYIANDGKAKRTFLLSAESFIVTGAFVEFLKRSTGRYRPYTGRSHDTWAGPSISGNNDKLSFPSGDASSAFALASVVASEYNNAVVPPVVYTAATLIALERVHSNAHWASDVFVGSAIGYFTGKAIVSFHSAGKENNISFAPMIDGNDVGFVITYSY